jgi:hypothetical protein
MWLLIGWSPTDVCLELDISFNIDRKKPTISASSENIRRNWRTFVRSLINSVPDCINDKQSATENIFDFVGIKEKPKIKQLFNKAKFF